jgi:hypothetical protein
MKQSSYADFYYAHETPFLQIGKGELLKFLRLARARHLPWGFGFWGVE